MWGRKGLLGFWGGVASCFWSMKEDSRKGIVNSLMIVGRTRGEVRRLAAFDKKRHSVPDRVCGATQAFLEKLCEEELTEEAEAIFQSAREHFGYKRREISLSVGSGFARLDAKDFVLELRYELDEEDPGDYVVEICVREVASRDLLESGPFQASVGSRFDRLRCGLQGTVSVEAVIDAVEDDESGETRVDYPSDCSSCTVRIDGVAGEVFVDGAILEVRFGKLASAAALMEAFDRIGEYVLEAAGLGGLLE
ncbi:hypothetical protein VDG1235_1454 [Verrucomicrobiia bacterium DG1235]|nr:hypothetical protein VDG1235_1454 [Verrucomicrobiae bacterium DG1235]